MSKKNKILLCVLLLVYIIALAILHATYDYTIYWEEETTIILRYSFIYIIIGLVIYWAFNRKVSNITIKSATKLSPIQVPLKRFFVYVLSSSMDISLLFFRLSKRQHGQPYLSSSLHFIKICNKYGKSKIRCSQFEKG